MPPRIQGPVLVNSLTREEVVGAADLIGGRSEMLRVNIYICLLRCEKVTLVGPSPFPVDLH